MRTYEKPSYEPVLFMWSAPRSGRPRKDLWKCPALGRVLEIGRMPPGALQHSAAIDQPESSWQTYQRPKECKHDTIWALHFEHGSLCNADAPFCLQAGQNFVQTWRWAVTQHSTAYRSEAAKLVLKADIVASSLHVSVFNRSVRTFASWAVVTTGIFLAPQRSA